MAFILLLFILCVTETLQHLSYPMNFCNMASTCLHDNRPVCGTSPDGCSRKSFIDQCDMYEYNCDYGTRYEETYILFCGNLNTPTLLTEIQSIVTKNPTGNENNETSLKLTTLLPKNITKSDANETDNEINTNTILLTEFTSTSVTPNVTNNLIEDVTNVNDNHEIIKSSSAYCCERPLTWETTKEITKILEVISLENNISNEETTTQVNNITEDISVENNISNENKQTTENSVEYNITEYLNDQTTNLYENENHTALTTNHQVSDTIKLKGKTEGIENTDPDETFVQTESNMKIVDKTTTVYCCNRPITWETTTEVTKMLEEITKNNTQADTKDETKEKDKNSDDIHTIAHTSDTTARYITTKYSTTSATTDLKLRLTTSTKLRKISKPTNNCNNKCQRPVTWLTTVIRRRKHLNYFQNFY